jgi:hypothetical protein
MALKLSQLNKDEYRFEEPTEDSVFGKLKAFAKGVPVGIAKSFGDLALGTGELGRKIQGALPVPDAWKGTESLFDQGSEQNIAARTALTADAPGEGTGKFVGTAAQYLAPTGMVTKSQGALANLATRVPTAVGRTVAGAAARAIPEATATGLVTAVRTGGDTEQVKDDALLAGGASVAFNTLGGIARSTYFPQLKESVAKALGIQGKQSGGAALRATTEKAAGLQVLKDNAKNVTVTLDDGTKAAFDPKKATYGTTLQAWNETRKQIYKKYTDLADTVGGSRTLDLTDIREKLANVNDAPVLSVYKNAASSLLKDFDSAFPDATSADMMRAQQFVESLNSQTVSGFFKGTSDAASSEINAGTSRVIREKMDDLITETTGGNYQELRSQYAALKSLEDDLVRKFQQHSRSIGGGLAEYAGMFSSGDILSGILSANPGQTAKGTLVSALALAKRLLSDPERYLRRSFELVDQEAPNALYQRIFGGY